MPFGLTNAPATFQRYMDVLLSGLNWIHCLVYLDDIIIFSSDFDQHLKSLELIFNRLRTANYHLKASKCKFGLKKVHYLGHIISHDGVEPDPDKIKSIMDTEPPKDIKQLRTFLGLTGYYRRFIKNYSELAQPFTSLLRKGAHFSWDSKKDLHFKELKDKLMCSPILALPNFNKPFQLETDASNFALGSVLSQKSEEGDRVIAYHSRVLNKAESNYSTTDRECLAVIDSIKKFRPYLISQPFTVITEHHSLQYLHNQKNPTGRIGRWIMDLQPYNMTVIHRPGKQHQNADALSRLPVHRVNHLHENFDTDNLLSEQKTDTLTSQLLDYINKGILPKSSKESKEVIGFARHCHLGDNGILYHLWWPSGPHRNDTRIQIFVPKSMITTVLNSCHDDLLSGHLGLLKTFNKVRSRFFWPGYYRDTKNWIDSCTQCNKKNTPRKLKQGHMIPMLCTQPFEQIGVDITGPLPTTYGGNRYILVFTDYSPNGLKHLQPNLQKQR